MVTCYLGVGSNLGERKKNIQVAVEEIAALKRTKVIQFSRVFETKPVGGPRQGNFLNAALKIQTSLSPAELLRALRGIEKKLGRKKTVRYGPRIIDLDILLYNQRIVMTNNLQIPHPRMFERDFVFRPLSEIL